MKNVDSQVCSDFCGAAGLLVGTLASLQAEPTTKDWIRGTGENLQIRLRGEIFLPDGQPAKDITVGGGNIGHASRFEGKKHLQMMLLKTRQLLTDAEIEQIIDSLDD